MGARAAAAIASAAGLTALAGWIFDVAVLRGVASVVGTRPITALGFLLAGASLWLLVPERAGTPRRAGQALGALAAAIGAASLTDDVVGAGVGVAELPLGGALSAAQTASAGSPQTAMGLLLLGVCLVTLDAQRPGGQWLTELLVLLTAAIGFYSLVAYAYGSGPSSAQALSPISPQTALMLLVLCAGIICARPGHPVLAMMRGKGAGALMVRRLLPIAILVMPAVGWLRLHGERAGLYDHGAGVALFVAVVVAIFVAGIVVTARLLERAGEELRQSEAFLDSVLEHIPHMIFVKDAKDLRFVRLNRAGEELLGYARTDLIGKSDYDLFPREEAEFFTGKDREVLRSRELLDIPEEPIETRDDGSRYLHTKKIPILDGAGTPRYLLGISEDITDRKQSQEAVRRAMEEAERANRAKSEFLSRMSHELRTPLNSIIGFGQLLEMDGLDEPRREYVDRILKGGRHLLDLINEVLDISRIEAGTLGISLEPVDAHIAVTEALALIRPMAADRGVRIYLPAEPPEHLYVTADQQRLKQVLLNLFSNGVKYNRDDGSITVSLDDRGERVRFVVADTGAGLSPEQVQRLFVPFERLGVQGHEIEGTGLGLALSKRLAEAMGGTLDLESERGVGSTFFLELPRAQRPRSDVELSPSGHVPAEAANDSRSKVLYIEDNLSNLRLVEEILSHRPELELIAAMQGSLGLELAERHRPELIILDVHLPDMPGGDVLARLHSEPATQTIPVVVLSADATEAQIKRLVDAGARAYLTKPLDVRRFLEVIDEHISPSRTQGHNETESEASWMPQR